MSQYYIFFVVNQGIFCSKMLCTFIAISLMSFEYSVKCALGNISSQGWSVGQSKGSLISSHWIYFRANIRWREPSYWMTGSYCHNDLSRVDEVLGTSPGNMAAWLEIWQRGLLKLIDYLPNRMKTNGGGCITSRLIFLVAFFNWRCIALPYCYRWANERYFSHMWAQVMWFRISWRRFLFFKPSSECLCGFCALQKDAITQLVIDLLLTSHEVLINL